MNLYVILCGVSDDELPDAYGPFSSKEDAEKYLDGHGKPGWNGEDNPAIEPECFGGVYVKSHAIVELFK